MMLRALLTIGAVQVITMLVLLVRTKTLAVFLGPEAVGVIAVIDKLLAENIPVESIARITEVPEAELAAYLSGRGRKYGGIR